MQDTQTDTDMQDSDRDTWGGSAQRAARSLWARAGLARADRHRARGGGGGGRGGGSSEQCSSSPPPPLPLSSPRPSLLLFSLRLSLPGWLAPFALRLATLIGVDRASSKRWRGSSAVTFRDVEQAAWPFATLNSQPQSSTTDCGFLVEDAGWWRGGAEQRSRRSRLSAGSHAHPRLPAPPQATLSIAAPQAHCRRVPQAARQTQCGQDLRGRKLSGSERKLSKEVGSHGLSASLRLEGVGGLLVVAGLGPRIVREDIAGFKGRPPAPAATRSLGLGLGGGRHGNFGKMALPVRESLPLAVRRREPERGQSRYSGGSTGPEGHG
eukprot:138205-Rhodomonas_salina.1